MLGLDKKICSICGKNEHHAKGMCGSCYSKNLKLFTKKKCEICGSSNYHGRGLCKACYSKEITEPKDKEKRKKYREEHPIIEQKDLLCVKCGKRGCFAKNKCRKCYNKEWSSQDAQKEKRARWRELHENYERERKRLLYKKNKERYDKKNREYGIKHKVRLRKLSYESKKTRLKNDPEFRIGENLRALIREGLKKKNCEKKCKTTELLGTTILKAVAYIEAQFKDGMSWDNYGMKGWNIDHFVPRKAFNLRYIEHQKICFHYTNLQPLWWKDNNKKSDIIPLGWDGNGK